VPLSQKAGVADYFNVILERLGPHTDSDPNAFKFIKGSQGIEILGQILDLPETSQEMNFFRFYN